MAFVAPTTHITGYVVTASDWNQDLVYNMQDLAQSGFTVIIDGGGVAITTGIKSPQVYVPFDCTITSWTLLADQSGSIVIDIWKDTYANYPPVDGDSITSSSPPTLSSATKNQDSTLSGWTKGLAQGSILRFNVDSCATCTWVSLHINVTRPD